MFCHVEPVPATGLGDVTKTRDGPSALDSPFPANMKVDGKTRSRNNSNFDTFPAMVVLSVNGRPLVR